MRVRGIMMVGRPQCEEIGFDHVFYRYVAADSVPPASETPIDKKTETGQGSLADYNSCQICRLSLALIYEIPILLCILPCLCHRMPISIARLYHHRASSHAVYRGW